MLNKSEFDATKTVLTELGFKPDAQVLELFKKIFFGKTVWHYTGARLCYSKYTDPFDLFAEAYFNTVNFNKAFKFVQNLILKGHTSITGTTYTYFLLPSAALSPELLKNLLNLPFGAVRLEKIYDELYLLILSDRLFAELLITDDSLRKKWRAFVESLPEKFNTEKERFKFYNNTDIILNDYYLFNIFDYIRFTEHGAPYSYIWSQMYEPEVEVYLDDYYRLTKLKPRRYILKYFKEYFTPPKIMKLAGYFPLEGDNYIYDKTAVMNLCLIHPSLYNSKKDETIKTKVTLKEDITDKLLNSDVFDYENKFLLIFGTDKVTTHQIVRHKTLNFLQKSNRYVKVRPTEFLIPKSYIDTFVKNSRNDTEFAKKLKDLVVYIKKAYKAYESDVKEGVKKSAARFRLPQFQKTDILISGLKRFIDHFIEERTSSAAQEEIRYIAQLIRKFV